MKESTLASCQEVKEINKWVEENIMISKAEPEAQAIYTLAIILNSI